MTTLTALRHAIACGEYETAQSLWESFTAATLQEISSGVCPAARLTETRELIAWARQQAVCYRAQAQNQLNTLHVAQQYEPPAAPSRTMWGVL